MSDKPTVHAVMKVLIEVPVRPSSPDETMQQMHDASKKEAARILQNKLPPDFQVVGPIEFSHAVVKA